MEEKTYWFITVFHDFDDKWGISSWRTWGFYANKEDALDALMTNKTDMWETIYNYAVLEGYEEGICGYTFERQFFSYSIPENGYFEIEEPPCVKHICSFALG